MEEWKNINGYESFYMISSYGRVKSLERVKIRKNGRPYYVKEKILDGSINKVNGYLYVSLVDENGEIEYKSIHRLVAITFELPLPEHLKWHDYEELEVNHKDENKTNNSIENLEWCDTKYNSNYGSRNERISIKNSKQVVGYDKNGNEVCRYNSVVDAIKDGQKGHIGQVANGQRIKANNIYWRWQKK